MPRCLISAAALPCLDAIPIPADTNEMATFALCLYELNRVCGGLDLFCMVAADAGSCSLENASLVRNHKLHSRFALKSTQPTLYNEACRLLAPSISRRPRPLPKIISAANAWSSVESIFACR
jgi:hypothetical protein